MVRPGGTQPVTAAPFSELVISLQFSILPSEVPMVLEDESLSSNPNPNPNTTPEEPLIKRKLGFESSLSNSATKKSRPDTHSHDPSSSSKNDNNGEEGNSKEPQKNTFVIEADSAEDRGARPTMEDACVMLPNASLDSPANLRCAHFAIYDGHGGRLAAEYAQKHLHSNVLSAGLPRESLDIKTAKKAILDGFRRTDESLLQDSTAGGWQDGATAVCIWVLGQTVFVANIGDAKAVVARSASTVIQNNSFFLSPLKAIVLTREHKALYPQEHARIKKAGGFVSSNGRIQGRLEVSRAFGDRQFKKVGVSAMPDIQSFDVSERDHFIILGCDGLWGVFGPDDAVEFVRKLLKDNVPVTSACRRLVKEAVRERGCKDNCTAILIVFRRP